MNEEILTAVRINQDLCSRCKVCYSLCPFEAIDLDPVSGRLNHNIQKCQVCGICYSACPVSAIEMSYYNYDGLLDHVRSASKDTDAETLVVMCRGNSPKNGEVEDILAAQGLGGKSYVPMRVPCAGRIPTNLIFHALKSGMKNIVSIQCHDEFCRMKEGAKIGNRRMLLGMNVIEQLGYPTDTLKVVRYSRKVIRDNKECVGCGKCVFICPYNAISAEPFSSPTTDPNKCMGCGSCQMVCPHNAIQVKGYEFEDILSSYGGVAAKMKAHDGRASILVLSCQWSEYSALDDPEKTLKGKNAMILEVPCFKGIDPVHVVNAYAQGFDGVMAVVCSANDCRMHQGRDTSERQLEVLQAYLKRLDLLERFEIHELSPRHEGEFISNLDAFYEKISAMPSRTCEGPRGGPVMPYKILTKKQLAPKETLFEVAAPEVAAKARPGQFLIVIAKEGGERVPLTISDYDAKKGTVSFAFHEVGKTTKELGTFREGERLFNVTGPLGNPSEMSNFGRVLCVGGSIMIAPLLLLAKALKEEGNHVTTVLGCRSNDFLFMKDEAIACSDEVCIASDDGTVGEKGLDFLKELLEKEKFDRCVVMGPVEMMKRVSDITRPFGIPTRVTLTPIMIDGMGMCGVCRVTVGGKMMFGCVDGPEFDGHLTNFDELIKRQRTMLPEERLSSVMWETNGGCKRERK